MEEHNNTSDIKKEVRIKIRIIAHNLKDLKKIITTAAKKKLLKGKGRGENVRINRKIKSLATLLMNYTSKEAEIQMLCFVQDTKHVKDFYFFALFLTLRMMVSTNFVICFFL